VRVWRVFFLEVWSDFQGLQRLCQCRIVLASVHWALIRACSGNGVMGMDIMLHGDMTWCGGHGRQVCLRFMYHVGMFPASWNIWGFLSVWLALLAPC
jgi:hypothetical protein